MWNGKPHVQGTPRKVERNQEVSTKSAIRILTKADHPIRPYFMSPNKLDEYTMRPRNPQPLFIRTAEYLGETQIDISTIEMVPKYVRPLWKPVNGRPFDVRLSAFGPRTGSERYRTEMTSTLDEEFGNTSRYLRMDGRWETK
jgi:hypothetical protein